MPNVVFIMTDEQNLRGLSCYRGTACQTPSVDGLADEGVLEVVAEDPWIVFPGNLQGRHAREPRPDRPRRDRMWP